jgi:hypothetical protein
MVWAWTKIQPHLPYLLLRQNGHYLFGSGFFGFWVLEKKEFPRTLCYKVF